MNAIASAEVKNKPEMKPESRCHREQSLVSSTSSCEDSSVFSVTADDPEEETNVLCDKLLLHSPMRTADLVSKRAMGLKRDTSSSPSSSITGGNDNLNDDNGDDLSSIGSAGESEENANQASMGFSPPIESVDTGKKVPSLTSESTPCGFDGHDDNIMGSEENDQKSNGGVGSSCNELYRARSIQPRRRVPGRTLSGDASRESAFSAISTATSGGNRRGSISGFFARSLAAEAGDTDALRKLLQDEVDLLQSEQDLDRDRLRLESFETYVLVSVMSASASFASFQATDFDSFPGFFPTALCYLKMACSSISALFGLYSTIVFSLCVLYGKTALGMKKDDMFEYFVKSTGKQRIRGFQAFSLSLQCFAGEVALTIVGRMGWVAAIAAVFALFVIINDLHAIIEAAGPIFTGIIPNEDNDKKKKMS